MYASRSTQLMVGLFALLGIAALAYLSVRLGNVRLVPTPGYTLYANFDNISGLKTDDQVQLAGVPIGKVLSISLLDNRAHVAMRINKGVQIDRDAIAAIKTSGIIGDKYVSIALGPGEHDLANGETIRQTQSAFVLEDAIGQLISNASSSSKSSDSSAGANQASAGGNSLPSMDEGCSSKTGNRSCVKKTIKKK